MFIARTHDEESLPLPPLFRSEGFAEDLDAVEPLPAPTRLRLMLGLAAPLVAALMGLVQVLTGPADATTAAPAAASTALSVTPARA